MNEEVYFWHGVKQSFLQADTMILGVGNQASQKYPKKEICIFLQYLQKNMGNAVYFLFADKEESFH